VLCSYMHSHRPCKTHPSPSLLFATLLRNAWFILFISCAVRDFTRAFFRSSPFTFSTLQFLSVTPVSTTKRKELPHSHVVLAKENRIPLFSWRGEKGRTGIFFVRAEHTSSTTCEKHRGQRASPRGRISSFFFFFLQNHLFAKSEVIAVFAREMNVFQNVESADYIAIQSERRRGLKWISSFLRYSSR